MKGKKCRSCDKINPPDSSRCLGCHSDIEFEPVKEFDELENGGVSVQRTRQEQATDAVAPPDDTKNSLFSFEGRINRGTFWTVIIPLFLISFALQVGTAVSAGKGGSGGIALLTLVYFIPAIWVALATYVKRWHDLNMSGWMVLTLLIPFANLLILLYLGLAPGTAGANKYGEAPR